MPIELSLAQYSMEENKTVLNSNLSSLAALIAYDLYCSFMRSKFRAAQFCLTKLADSMARTATAMKSYCAPQQA